MMKRKWIQKQDILVLAVLLFTAAAVYAGLALSSGEEKRVVITLNSQVLYDIALDEVESEQKLKAGSVSVLVTPQGARVIAADCPDGLCIACGLLENAGDTAVCVPGHVSVQIVSGQKDGLDAVVY